MLKDATNNVVLRKALDQVTAKDSTDAELKEQIQQIANLGTMYPHSISLLGETVPGGARFNCYQYAFGLENITLRVGIMREVRPLRDFVRAVVDGLLDEISIKDVQNQDYAIYANLQIEHAGKVREGAIASKWGLGHLWSHGLYELPLKYGEKVRFFRCICREEVLRAFLDFHPSGVIEGS